LGSVRVQYFGPRPLVDDNSVRSNSSTIVNARVGYKFQSKPFENWRLLVDVFNIFNAKVSDIDYFYTSRLPGEPPGGVNDIHTHPAEPLEARVTLKMTF
jgi:outer membrane receptor protein involved in Fe transport